MVTGNEIIMLHTQSGLKAYTRRELEMLDSAGIKPSEIGLQDETTIQHREDQYDEELYCVPIMN